MQAEFLRQAGESMASLLPPGCAGRAVEAAQAGAGMLLEAAADHGIDWRTPGSSAIRRSMWNAAGAPTETIQVLTGYGAAQPCDADLVCKDVLEGVDRILNPSAGTR